MTDNELKGYIANVVNRLFHECLIAREQTGVTVVVQTELQGLRAKCTLSFQIEDLHFPQEDGGKADAES